MRTLKAVLIGMLVMTSGLGCKRPAPTPTPGPPPFSGCVVQNDDGGHWHFQCENADGLWRCTEKMDKSSCVWDKPLPPGHPLRRLAESCLADNAR